MNLTEICATLNNKDLEATQDHTNHLHLLGEHDGGKSFYLASKKITSLYIFPVVSVLGIVGNILIALIYHRSKKFSTNVYLIALSLCDTVKLANDFLYFVVNLVELFDESSAQLMMYYIYNFSHYIFLVSATNTSWLTCAIAIDRWNYITHTSAAMKRHQKQQQHKRSNFYLQAIVVSVAIVLTSVVVNVPAPLFVKSVLCRNESSGKYTTMLVDATYLPYAFKTHYSFTIGLTKAVLPFFLLVFLNYKIVRFIYQVKLKETDHHQAGEAISEHVGGAVARSKTRITHMLLSIVLCFTACILPDAILTMMRYGYATEGSYYVRGVRELTDTLLAINSATTFLICVYFSTEFRKKLKQLLKCADAEPSATSQRGTPHELLNQQQRPLMSPAERLKQRRSIA